MIKVLIHEVYSSFLAGLHFIVEELLLYSLSAMVNNKEFIFGITNNNDFICDLVCHSWIVTKLLCIHIVFIFSCFILKADMVSSDRRVIKKLDMCLWNKDAPGGNKV